MVLEATEYEQALELDIFEFEVEVEIAIPRIIMALTLIAEFMLRCLTLCWLCNTRVDDQISKLSRQLSRLHWGSRIEAISKMLEIIYVSKAVRVYYRTAVSSIVQLLQHSWSQVGMNKFRYQIPKWSGEWESRCRLVGCPDELHRAM